MCFDSFRCEVSSEVYNTHEDATAGQSNFWRSVGRFSAFTWLRGWILRSDAPRVTSAALFVKYRQFILIEKSRENFKINSKWIKKRELFLKVSEVSTFPNFLRSKFVPLRNLSFLKICSLLRLYRNPPLRNYDNYRFVGPARRFCTKRIVFVESSNVFLRGVARVGLEGGG